MPYDMGYSLIAATAAELRSGERNQVRLGLHPLAEGNLEFALPLGAMEPRREDGQKQTHGREQNE
jgi:hypothetical protein